MTVHDFTYSQSPVPNYQFLITNSQFPYSLYPLGMARHAPTYTLYPIPYTHCLPKDNIQY
jgi:hypothetical protein